MPYIREEDRAKFAPAIDAVPHIQSAGELNYLLTLIALKYVGQHGLSYQTLNDVCGALHNTNAELQRRLVAPYEDAKIEQNGDVYPQWESLVRK